MGMFGEDLLGVCVCHHVIVKVHGCLYVLQAHSLVEAVESGQITLHHQRGTETVDLIRHVPIKLCISVSYHDSCWRSSK